MMGYDGIIKNPTKLKGASIYVVRYSEEFNQYKLSYPCDNCVRLMASLGIRRVYYSLDSPVGKFQWESATISELKKNIGTSKGHRCKTYIKP